MDQCGADIMGRNHVHELQGSVKVAERGCDCHNHRFAVETGKAIPCGSSHIHEVSFKTDTYEGHEHVFCGKTSTAIVVGDRHVHFIKDCTESEDGHRHEFRASTFMDDLIGD